MERTSTCVFFASDSSADADEFVGSLADINGCGDTIAKATENTEKGEYVYRVTVTVECLGMVDVKIVPLPETEA